MQFEVKQFPKTKFIGISMTFTFADYKSFELWSTFMPRRNELENRVGTDFYNIQINPDNFDFAPNSEFQKWAVVPVTNFDFVPDRMNTLEIQEGLYAVFHYKGNQINAANFFKKIYTEWLPESKYQLDNRAQFEILGKKYQRNSEESEEEIWIPIKEKL